MHIKEDNMQEAVHYLLSLTEQDVNPAFKGHAKEWLQELRYTWGMFKPIAIISSLLKATQKDVCEPL